MGDEVGEKVRVGGEVKVVGCMGRTLVEGTSTAPTRAKVKKAKEKKKKKRWGESDG